VKQVKIAGKIHKATGNTVVKAPYIFSLGFCLLTREQLDRRLAEAHA